MKKLNIESAPLRHHAFVIETGAKIEYEAEDGIRTAQKWAERELRMTLKNNPDVIVLKYGLFSIKDARRVSELAAGAACVGDYKVIIISANRVYHEAQNALLKLFEEPPKDTYLFLILPTLGSLLPTLRSRVQTLNPGRSDLSERSDLPGLSLPEFSELAEKFIQASKERNKIKRDAIIKKLTEGKDEDEKHKNREEVIHILNSIEARAYAAVKVALKGPTFLNSGRSDLSERSDLPEFSSNTALLSDISILREYLYDRSAPVRMILEHISLLISKK